ncbi:uncharacterized protein LOC130980315 [Arachis stenosperma]|uniref:uncharacterized protein LOC130980315 n=1 Tax=Arachis stenosperma TaxID=217475 RepID=UPI0025ABF00D|nr:uncharacterized protein LOC130980315 [Arachis stenosperma]
MASDESFVTLVHYRGSIKKKTRSGIKFTDKDPLSVFLKPSISFAEFKNTIQRLGLHGVKRVKKLFYRISIFVLRDDLKCDSFVISSDKDMQLRPCLNRSCDALVGEAGPLREGASAAPNSPPFVPIFGEVGAPNEVEDALHDDEDDDVEPAMIADDSNEKTRTTPPVDGGASSSGTNQYPPHFSALDLDAMAPQEDPSVPIGFGARDTQNAGDVAEFQVGQQFQHKEKVVFSVKTYSICRGVEYKVLESDHRKYHGKCKEFGNGCVWLIWVSLCKHKGILEIKRYNGPRTCLATSISSDHRKLDYHVISVFIMPMIRADAVTSIKVLQNATEAHFGFKPTYIRVWMAKQKAVSRIYGDWKDSYNEFPR